MCVDLSLTSWHQQFTVLQNITDKISSHRVLPVTDNFGPWNDTELRSAFESNTIMSQFCSSDNRPTVARVQVTVARVQVTVARVRVTVAHVELTVARMQVTVARVELTVARFALTNRSS